MTDQLLPNRWVEEIFCIVTTESRTSMSGAEVPHADRTSLVKMEGFLNEDDSNVAEVYGVPLNSIVVRVVLSNKGGPKVIHRGFMYTLHKKQPNNIRWRCVGRTLHCRGSLITTADCKKPRIRMQHNHDPDFVAAELARKRYIALGQPPVILEDELRSGSTRSGNAKRDDFVSWANWPADDPPSSQHRDTPSPSSCQKDDETKRATRSSSGNSGEFAAPPTEWPTIARQEPRQEQLSPIPTDVIPTVSQTNSAGKGIRIGQSLIRPRTIVPSSSLQSQQMQQHHQTHTQNQHHQQQQQQPKTLVLKAIPLKVKHVSPTTIKMARRQTSAEIPKNPAPAQQPTEVCLRWNSYHSNMQNSFPSLLDSEEFVDVTLACEGRSLKCHKMILSSCSDYLANLLRENPCQHPIILMKDLKFWEVEALVKFMYRGEVNVAHDKLPQLLNAAEALQVKGLAGPSPSSQNSKPPMLIPQPKPSTSQPAISRLTTEAKDSKHHFTGAANVATPPKRSQKRQLSESNENHKPFTKIRLQRPASPVSPVVTVKLEPLDIPLSPTEMFADERDNPSSSSTRYGNLPNDFRGEEGSEGTREVSSTEREINFCEIPGPPDLNDSEEQMEFVPTDFLEQEQDILDEQDGDHEGEDCEDIDDDDIGEELNESNDKDDMPGRRSGDDRDEVDDEENDCEYSEKLSDENNTT
ncbi:protein jim lovell-like isoform X2 [Athalia rosae]|uniref:protein jim lovell-like isoform X2 n=1 Tax=Athalia rosae TaxID=37344 RepID=UPI002034851A|nr:protein jim lovell-like isoform X2 [Athalia rosae]